MRHMVDNMKCKWCGFESEGIEDSEEDYKNYRGVWFRNVTALHTMIRVRY